MEITVSAATSSCTTTSSASAPNRHPAAKRSNSGRNRERPPHWARWRRRKVSSEAIASGPRRARCVAPLAANRSEARRSCRRNCEERLAMKAAAFSGRGAHGARARVWRRTGPGSASMRGEPAGTPLSSMRRPPVRLSHARTRPTVTSTPPGAATRSMWSGHRWPPLIMRRHCRPGTPASSNGSPPTRLWSSTARRNRRRDPPAPVSHHDRRKGEGIGAWSTKRSHCVAHPSRSGTTSRLGVEPPTRPPLVRRLECPEVAAGVCCTRRHVFTRVVRGAGPHRCSRRRRLERFPVNCSGLRSRDSRGRATENLLFRSRIIVIWGQA